MAMPSGPGAGPAPSRRTLALACAGAFVVAGILLATIVLPAEYGIDPLGAGRALGVSALASGGAGAGELPPPPPEGAPLAPTPQGPAALYPAAFKVDAREFELGPDEYIEYKYHLEKGATMMFSWAATDAVEHEFHGDPDGAPASASQSYEKRARRDADGSFVAPFSGIHGWYWENPGGETIRIKLTTAGFYAEAHEFSFDGTRQSRAVRALDAIAPAAAGD